MKTIFIIEPGMWDPVGSFNAVKNGLEKMSYPCFVVEDDHKNYRQGVDYYLKRLVSFVRKTKSRNEISKIVLIGHCIGLPLCLKAAEITGLVNGIINLSGAPFKLGLPWENIWSFRYLFGKMTKRPFRYIFPIVFGRKMSIHDSDVSLLTSDVKIAEGWGKKREPSSGRAARELMRGIFVDLKKIPPVFSWICCGDRIINPDLQEKVAKKLVGKKSYSNYGHWAQLEQPLALSAGFREISERFF